MPIYFVYSFCLKTLNSQIHVRKPRLSMMSVGPKRQLQGSATAVAQFAVCRVAVDLKFRFVQTSECVVSCRPHIITGFKDYLFVITVLAFGGRPRPSWPKLLGTPVSAAFAQTCCCNLHLEEVCCNVLQHCFFKYFVMLKSIEEDESGYPMYETHFVYHRWMNTVDSDPYVLREAKYGEIPSALRHTCSRQLV